MNRFGLNLFEEVVNEEKGKNAFVSPLSVSMALGMAYNGAAGTTREAMQKTLELSGLTIEEVNKSYENLMGKLVQLDSKVQFQIANSIWCRQEVDPKEEFIESCQKYFKGSVDMLDFACPTARDVINSWVSENTNEKIRTIIDSPIGPIIIMILVNAIYFKGTWTHEFDKKLTEDAMFNQEEPCRLMKQMGSFSYFENDDFQAVELLYGNKDFAMTILLPRPDKDIDALINELDENQPWRWSRGTVHLPIFKAEYGIKLNAALKALGMAVAFDPDRADFTGMCDLPKVWIDTVKHKVYISVDEEGTEAAAVTAMAGSGMACASLPPPPFEMRIDRPFLFTIKEKATQSTLFMGKVTALRPNE